MERDRVAPWDSMEALWSVLELLLTVQRSAVLDIMAVRGKGGCRLWEGAVMAVFVYRSVYLKRKETIGSED